MASLVKVLRQRSDKRPSYNHDSSNDEADLAGEKHGNASACKKVLWDDVNDDGDDKDVEGGGVGASTDDEHLDDGADDYVDEDGDGDDDYVVDDDDDDDNDSDDVEYEHEAVPVLEVPQRDSVVNTSTIFTTDQSFWSKLDLKKWVDLVGHPHNVNVIIQSSRQKSFYLSCARAYKPRSLNGHVNHCTTTSKKIGCKFKMVAYRLDSGWKLRVSNGWHNHELDEHCLKRKRLTQEEDEADLAAANLKYGEASKRKKIIRDDVNEDDGDFNDEEDNDCHNKEDEYEAIPVPEVSGDSIVNTSRFFTTDQSFPSKLEARRWVDLMGRLHHVHLIVQSSRPKNFYLTCERAYEPRRSKNVGHVKQRARSSKKSGCKFRLTGYLLKNGNWKLRVSNGWHNHELDVQHTERKRLNQEEVNFVREQYALNVAPADILSQLEMKNPYTYAVIKDVYNQITKMKREKKFGC